MKTLSIIVAAALLALCSAHARLGESEAEVEARYGKGKTMLSDARGVSKSYKSGGLQIFVTFFEGRSNSEMYAKLNDGRLDDAEIRVLLDANSGGLQWEAGEQRSDGPLWTVADRVAHYDRFKGWLTIFSRSDSAKIKAAKEEAAKAKLKAF